MRYLLALLLFTSPAWATWSLVQHPNKTTCGSVNSCAITVTSTGSGHLGVAVALQGNFSSVISSVSGGGTWTLCPSSGCHSSSGKTDLAYNLNLSAGATTITFNFSQTQTVGVIEFLEFSTTSTPALLDNIGTPVLDSPCTTCAGIATSPTGNDLIVQTISQTNGATVSAISGTYTSPADFLGVSSAFVGIAASINTSDGTAPTWTQSAGNGALVEAIAFKETLTSIPPHRPLVY